MVRSIPHHSLFTQISIAVGAANKWKGTIWGGRGHMHSWSEYLHGQKVGDSNPVRGVLDNETSGKPHPRKLSVCFAIYLIVPFRTAGRTTIKHAPPLWS